MKVRIEHTLKDAEEWDAFSEQEKVVACLRPDAPLWWILATYSVEKKYPLRGAPTILGKVRRMTKRGEVGWLSSECGFSVPDSINCKLWLNWAVRWKHTHPECLEFVHRWLRENRIYAKGELYAALARHPSLSLSLAQRLLGKYATAFDLAQNPAYSLWILEDPGFHEQCGAHVWSIFMCKA